MSPLAIDLVPWLGGLCALLVAVLALVVVAPWRKDEDVALDPEVQARLLLGEDPEEIDQQLGTEQAGTPPVADLHPEPEPPS
jgi:hypothetical protein